PKDDASSRSLSVRELARHGRGPPVKAVPVFAMVVLSVAPRGVRPDYVKDHINPLCNGGRIKIASAFRIGTLPERCTAVRPVGTTGTGDAVCRIQARQRLLPVRSHQPVPRAMGRR